MTSRKSFEIFNVYLTSDVICQNSSLKQLKYFRTAFKNSQMNNIVAKKIFEVRSATLFIAYMISISVTFTFI